MYVIYSQDSCRFCVMAKELLENHGQEYVEISIDEDTDAKNYIKSFTNTVPQIFLGKQLIGGYQELTEQLQHLHLYKD